MKTTKQRIAKEWLTFVFSLFGGLIVLAVYVLYAKYPSQGFLDVYASGLFWGNEFPNGRWSNWNFGAWIITLSPYILIQFIRSIIWSIGMIKNEEDQ